MFLVNGFQKEQDSSYTLEEPIKLKSNKFLNSKRSKLKNNNKAFFTNKNAEVNAPSNLKQIKGHNGFSLTVRRELPVKQIKEAYIQNNQKVTQNEFRKESPETEIKQSTNSQFKKGTTKNKKRGGLKKKKYKLVN